MPVAHAADRDEQAGSGLTGQADECLLALRGPELSVIKARVIVLVDGVEQEVLLFGAVNPAGDMHKRDAPRRRRRGPDPVLGRNSRG